MGGAVLDFVFLPYVHPEVVSTIGGTRAPAATDALLIVETTTVAAAWAVVVGVVDEVTVDG